MGTVRNIESRKVQENDVAVSVDKPSYQQGRGQGVIR